MDGRQAAEAEEVSSRKQPPAEGPGEVNEPTTSAVAPPWLSVIGIGDDGFASLGDKARRLISTGEILIGGNRHLEMIPNCEGKRLAWRRPLEQTLNDIEQYRGKNVVVLASGDPLWYGVGELLAKTFGADEMQVIPHASSFSLACARLGWSLAETETLSLHNRPTSTLRRHLAPGAKLALLTHDGETAHIIAAMLVERGFGPSRITVFEHLGGEMERRIDAIANSWPAKDIAALNTVAIDCLAGPPAGPVPLFCSSAPGLPDQVFESDGMLTKREVRAATFARLMPMNGQCLWDIGAGSGAISIEWLRCLKRGKAVAIERDEMRALRAEGNAEWLGTPELQIVQDEAPSCLDDQLPRPDAIFVGGGITAPGMLEHCWAALDSGGRLVANVVTLDGERKLLDWQAEHGGDLIRIAISRAEKVGPYQGWRPSMPVTQYATVKL